jgi:CRISPR-associated protein Csb1
MPDALDIDALVFAPRILFEAPLVPLQGHRFQPTGFPDLGAARYSLSDGTEMVLVESPQSVANRLEGVCWDFGKDELIPELRGLPYIRVIDPSGRTLTNSILEAHRLNSPYILEGEDKTMLDILKRETTGLESAVDLPNLARVVFKYDPNSVLHGVFLAKSELAGGRLRLTRVLSGFIEAQDARPAESGGVKNDRVDPGGDTTKGFGNVPFHRTEFTAGRITAYFNFDLSLLRGYGMGLDSPAGRLLLALGLFKVRRFLSTSLRLRTACDLRPEGDVQVTQPAGFSIPSEETLLSACRTEIENCKRDKLFAEPPVTKVTWRGTSKKQSKEAG